MSNENNMNENEIVESNEDTTVNSTNTSVNEVEVPTFSLPEVNDNIEDTTEVDMSNYTVVDADELDEDPPIPGQKIVLMSFMSPEGIMGCDVRAFKVRGVFDNPNNYTDEDERNRVQAKIDARVKELEAVDPYFKIYTCEVGKWCEFDPPDEHVEKIVGANEKEQKFIDAQAKHRQKQMNELAGKTKQKIDKDRRGFKERRDEAKITAAAEDRSNKMRSKRQEKMERKQEKMIERANNSDSARKQRMLERARRKAEARKKARESKASKLAAMKNDDRYSTETNAPPTSDDINSRKNAVNEASNNLSRKEASNDEARRNLEEIRKRLQK